MYNITENYDIYKSILSKEIILSWISIGIFILVFVVLLIALPIWIKNLKTKAEKIGWSFALATTCIICIVAIIWNVAHISDHLYDINNDAFIVHDDGFFVVTSTDYSHRPYTTSYDISFNDGKEDIQISLSEVQGIKYGLEQGEYTDAILVYSSRSKIIVDIINVSNSVN